ncbi:hypothetical protein C922_03020 [Plasmodium inui San Antonio 1]|uniref:Uncharacterized protein n=1 Tax=Plasmodium inui San Antonio 1 TaxID=1237626 RepID=W7A4N2_9APIC|nr:hypothetical protein C922_03020 [Plasmodium inui San Antonio 1]EUD66695.1 hypothetical protein C922_03020 [Plasmodium inui San Antonio 1]
MREKEEKGESRRFLFSKQTDWSRINFTFLVFVLGIKTVFCTLLFIYNHVLLFFIFFMSTVISLYALVVNTFKALTLYIVILTSILTSILLSLFDIIHVQYISSVFKEVFLSTVSYSVLPLFILELFVAIIYTCLKRRRKGYIERRLRELKIIIDGERNKEKGEKLLSLQIDLEKNELNTYDKTYKYYLTNYKNKKYICIEKKTDYSSDEEDPCPHDIGNDYIDYNAISFKSSTLKNQQSSSGNKVFQEEKNANKGSTKTDSLSYYHVSEDLSFIHSGIKKYAKQNERSNAKKKKSAGNGKGEGDTHTVDSCGDGYGSHMHSDSPRTKGRRRQWSNDKHSITDKGCTNLVNNETADDRESTSIISQHIPSQTQFLTKHIEGSNNKTMSNTWTETPPNHTTDQRENSKKGSAEYIKNSFSLENYEEVDYIIENFIEKNKDEGNTSVDLMLDFTKDTEQQNGAEGNAQMKDELDMESKIREKNDGLAQKEVPQDEEPQDKTPLDETPVGAFDLTPLPNVENQAEETNVQNDEEKRDNLLRGITSQVEEELIKMMTSQSSDHKGRIYAKCTAEEKDSGQFADVEDHHDDIFAKFEAQQNNQGGDLHSTVSEMEANQKNHQGAGGVDPNGIPNRTDNPLFCAPANMEEETKKVGATNEQELLMGEHYDNFKNAEMGAQEISPNEVTPVISPTNQAGEHSGKVVATHDRESYLEGEIQVDEEIKEHQEEQLEEQSKEPPTEQPSELPSGGTFQLPIEFSSYLPVKHPPEEPSQLHIEHLAALPSCPASSMPNGKEEKDDGGEDNEDSQSDKTSESKKTHEGEKQMRNFLCTNLEETNLLRSANYAIDTSEWIPLEKKDIEMLKKSVNINNIEHIPIDDFYTKNIKERGANLFSYSIHSSNISEFLKIGVDQKACASWGAQQEETLINSDDICKKINFANLENMKNSYVTLFHDSLNPPGGLNENENVTEWLDHQQMGTSHFDCNEMVSVHESSHVEGPDQTGEKHPSNDWQTGEKNPSNDFQPGEDSHQDWSEKKELDDGKENESNEKGSYPFEQVHISSNAFSSNLYTTEHGEYSNYEEAIRDNSNIAKAFLSSGMYGDRGEMGRSNISDELPPSSFDNPNYNIILNYSSCNDDIQSVPNSSLIIVKGEHGTEESEKSTSIFNRGSYPNSDNTNEHAKCMDDKDTNKKQNDTENIASNDMCQTTSIFKQRKFFFENLKKDKSLSSHPAKMSISNERNVLRKVSGKSEGEVLNSNSSINQHKKGNIPVEESDVSSSTPDAEANQTNTNPPPENFAKLKKAKNINDNFYIINDKLKSSKKEKKDMSVMGISPNEQLTPSNDLAGSSTPDLSNQVKENEMGKAKIIDEMEKVQIIEEMANSESNQNITQHFVIYDQSDLATPSTKLGEGTPTMGESHNLEKKKKIEGIAPNTVITVNNCTINSSAGIHIEDGKKSMFSSATQLIKDIFINSRNAEKIIHDVKTEGSYHKVSLLSQVKEVPTFGNSEESSFQHRKEKFTELKKETTPMNSNPLNGTPPVEITNSKLSAFADMNSDHTKEVFPSEDMPSEVMNSEACPYSGGLLPLGDKSLLTGSTQLDKFKDDFLNINSCDSSVMYRDYMDAMNSEGRPEVEQVGEAKVEGVEVEKVKEEVKKAKMDEVQVDAVPELVEVISEQMKVLSEPMEANSKSVEAPHEKAGNNFPHGISHSVEEEADAHTKEGAKSTGPNDAALDNENLHVLDDLPTQKAHLEMEKTNALGNSNPTCDVSSSVHTDKHEAGEPNAASDHLKEDQSPDTATDVKENYTNEICTKDVADEQPFSDDKQEGEEKPNQELTAKETLQEELTKDNFEGDEREPSYPHEEDNPVGDAAIYEGNEVPPLKEQREDITSSPTEQALDNLENVITPPMVEASTGGGGPKEEVASDEENSDDEIVDHNNHMDASDKAKGGLSENQNASKLNHEKAKNYRNRKNNKRRNKRR